VSADAQLVTVVGAGSWGTALAVHADRCEHPTRLWARRPAQIQTLRSGSNERYLPGIELADSIEIHDDLRKAIAGAELILLAVPSEAVGEACDRLRGSGLDPQCPVIGTAKGFERGSGRRLSEVMAEHLDSSQPQAQLLGPSHAEEVARGLVTAIVLAGEPKTCRRVQPLLSSTSLRIYTNDDLAGVETAAALKNVLAIASGICDGIGLGDNARGALLTRGVSEIARLGVRMGGRLPTFFGLAGIGDVITTCLSKNSRNRNLGERLAKGESLDDARKAIGQAVEGVETTRIALELAQRHEVAMPICEAVGGVLFDGVDPTRAIEELMQRRLKDETEDEWNLDSMMEMGDKGGGRRTTE